MVDLRDEAPSKNFLDYTNYNSLEWLLKNFQFEKDHQIDLDQAEKRWAIQDAQDNTLHRLEKHAIPYGAIGDDNPIRMEDVYRKVLYHYMRKKKNQ